MRSQTEGVKPPPDATPEPDLDLILDNLPWHALTGPQIELTQATPSGRARRLRRPVGVFCATDRLDGGGWGALIELVGPGRAIVLFQAEVGELPPGVDLIERHPVHQMVAGSQPTPAEEAARAAAHERGVVELGVDDVDEMLALTALTRPGPFYDETHQLGIYLGVREGGALVAMAGERLRAEGAAEISAVCTHPDARRQGLGAQLTAAVMGVMRQRGDRPLLHVATTNTSAIRVYDQLGFQVRRDVEAVSVRVHGQPGPSS